MNFPTQLLLWSSLLPTNNIACRFFPLHQTGQTPSPVREQLLILTTCPALEYLLSTELLVKISLGGMGAAHVQSTTSFQGPTWEVTVFPDCCMLLFIYKLLKNDLFFVANFIQLYSCLLGRGFTDLLTWPFSVYHFHPYNSCLPVISDSSLSLLQTPYWSLSGHPEI